MQKTICELFAGVGGFRLGFERLEAGWETTWFSQWEPGARTQWAHDCYVQHFGDSSDLNNEFHTGEDISTMDKQAIPNHTLLVGGFPCQDYSVAHTLSSSHGIEGKKGVLWWQIRDTIIAKKPPFCIFENVDRLLKSPAKQRGRDFGVILACLAKEGYSVEWRVVNAAQYGAAQRRRRIFIFAYRNDTIYGQKMADISADVIIKDGGLMAKAFPIQNIGQITETVIGGDIVDVSDNFAFTFETAGYMRKDRIYTSKVIEQEEEPIALGKILQKNVDDKFYINGKRLHRDISIPPSLGLIIEKPEFLSYMTGLENLKQLAAINKKVSDDTIKEYMRLFELDPESKQTMRRYSLGMKQKIGIIQALMENPDILILDEPFNALDEKSVLLLRKLLCQRRDEGKLIVVTSHHKDDIEAICDEVIVMQDGTLKV